MRSEEPAVGLHIDTYLCAFSNAPAFSLRQEYHEAIKSSKARSERGERMTVHIPMRNETTERLSWHTV